MGEIILKEESYKIVGACTEAHRELGMGFKEIIYKDALEMEFALLEIPYQREKPYTIIYKGKYCPESILLILLCLIQ